jgi:pyridoxine 4-dehydrogenase
MMSTFALGQMLVRRSGYGAMQLAGPYSLGRHLTRHRPAPGRGRRGSRSHRYGPVLRPRRRQRSDPRSAPPPTPTAWPSSARSRSGETMTVPSSRSTIRTSCARTSKQPSQLAGRPLAAVNLRLPGDGRADARFDDHLAAMVAARDEGLIAGVGRRALTGMRSNAIHGDGKSGPQPAHSRLSMVDRVCGAPVARITRIR